MARWEPQWPRRLAKTNGFPFLLSIAALASLVGCSVDSAKNHYLLGERLWVDRNYASAVAEFEKAVVKDPRGKLGQQALYREATTQYLFLGQYLEAVQNLKKYCQRSTDLSSIWSAQLQMGEILFNHLDQYDQVVLHYRGILKERPEVPEAPSFLFRIAKSHFYLFQFNDALQVYSELITKYPKSSWAEKAYFEKGMTYFTRGEKQSDVRGSPGQDFQLAIQSYQRFIQLYPKSEFTSEARFGIASCYEELDQLDEAYSIYSELRKSYPAPNVIEIKLIRIRERLAHRNVNRETR